MQFALVITAERRETVWERHSHALMTPVTQSVALRCPISGVLEMFIKIAYFSRHFRENSGFSHDYKSMYSAPLEKAATFNK